ncbi:cell division protein FtsQ [Pedobacter sp. KR3-3]|uniref:Cell division protein FtsQ n=1 Tax=Pedobacter albus TaxID=3113905 RepID=A0ABU7I6J5_9SPHI|nr:cell division protein FtsQ [Pedobacter sp. KR3-3]MEE1945102.1 cell division protein FtsQ [Pedobacter sp. KR3-3]
MLSSVNWKMILKCFAWLVCLAGVVVLMSFISVKKREVKCVKVEILIPGADNFIEREEIDAILKQGQGQLVGRNLEQINIHAIEETLKANPYIAFAKVFVDMDGVLQVAIKQRQPVLRVLNAGGQDYYIDSNGLKMPMSPNFTANVLVASGNILEGFSGKVDTLLTPMGADLYKTALFMKKDTLWDAQIEQLFVNDKHDIELVPRVGNQRIILGNADSLETKMNNLLAFYKQAMPTVGWNAYKTINLKYTNQIVCEKYDSLAVKKAKPVVADSTALANRAIDSAIKNSIQDEIKKAAAASTAQTAKPTTPKPVVATTNKPATTKPAEKTPAKTAAATTAKEKPKPAATKEKTDTKKNK